MKKFLWSLKHYLLYKLRSFLKYNKSEELEEKKRVIVSFTTLPSRFVNIKNTLSSLIYQTRIPDEIVIAIPRFSKREKVEYQIPDFINKIVKAANISGLFIKYPKISILHSDSDWGPATKFIPAIQREIQADRHDYILIIVDDDQIYQRTMISNFIKHHKTYKDFILCNRGRKLEKSMFYCNSEVILGTKIKDVTEVDIITGVGGYLINPELVDSSLWDYSDSPEGAFYMDDIWISGYFAKRGIKRLVVPSQSEILYRSKRDLHQSRIFKRNKQQDKTITLSDIPCKFSDNPREYYNNQVISYFSEYW